MTAEPAPFRVLFVCTGNLCRSPTAEALLRKRIRDAGATDSFTASSAGLAANDGRPIDPTVADLLRRRGVDDTALFRSRALTEQMPAQSDLLLTGTREHRLSLGKRCPEAYSRTFTLRECALLLRSMPADVQKALPARPPARPHAVVSWLQDERGLLAIPSSELDIADPIGRRTAFYRRMVNDVAAAVDTLADALLAGVGRPSAAE